MRYLSRFVMATVGLLSAAAAAAQRRSVGNVVVVPEAQVELAVAGDDYVLAAFNLVAASDRGGGATFAGGQLRLGYERHWNSRWSWGPTLRVLGGGGDYSYGDFLGLGGNLVPGLLLRHSGKIGAFSVGQRLGVERAITVISGQSFGKDRSLLRLRFDVDRQFAVGEKVALRPRLAYEVAAYPRLQRAENETKERVIDFGNLRAEVGLRFSPTLDLTPWVASQTAYFNFLPQFDSTGKQVGGGRTNLLTPLAGLDVRLMLGRSEAAAERRQLPSQH